MKKNSMDRVSILKSMQCFDLYYTYAGLEQKIQIYFSYIELSVSPVARWCIKHSMQQNSDA